MSEETIIDVETMSDFETKETLLDELRRITDNEYLTEDFVPFASMIRAFPTFEGGNITELATMHGCELDNAIVQFLLGLYQLKKKKASSARSWWVKSAKQGNTFAMEYLALQTYNKQAKKKKEYLKMAVDHGSMNAMHHLGWFYFMKRNYDLMKIYYLMAIELGCIESMINMAKYYGDEYYGQEKNYAMSEKYYLMAIEKGDNYSLHMLQYMYLDNPLALYRALLLMDESKQPAFVKTELQSLEQHEEVIVFKNLVRVFERLKNYKQCPICFDEDVLNITLRCGHELCVGCYKPNMNCYFRCTETSCKKMRVV